MSRTDDGRYAMHQKSGCSHEWFHDGPCAPSVLWAAGDTNLAHDPSLCGLGPSDTHRSDVCGPTRPGFRDAGAASPRTDPDDEFEQMLAGFDRIIHDKELQQQLLDAGLLVRIQPAAAQQAPAPTEAEQKAAEALLGFINPTTDPAEIERRGIEWAAFEQGRKFEHQWCRAAQEAPAPEGLHPDDGHAHSWGCRRCGVDPAPPTPAEPPPDAVEVLREAIHAHLCDFNNGEWEDAEMARTILTPWVRNALLRALRTEARPPEGLDTLWHRLYGIAGVMARIKADGSPVGPHPFVWHDLDEVLEQIAARLSSGGPG